MSSVANKTIPPTCNLLSPTVDRDIYPQNFSSITYKSTSSSQQTHHHPKILSTHLLPIDLHILELDNRVNKYKMHTIQQHQNGSYIEELTELLLADVNAHTKTIKNYEELDEKTNQLPIIYKPVVYQLAQLNRWAFIYESRQFLTKNGLFEQSDRFIILATEQFLPVTVTELAKKIIKMEYNDRFLFDHSIYQLDYCLVNLDNRQELKKNMSILASNTESCYYRQPTLQAEKTLQLNCYLKSLTNYKLLNKVCTQKYINLQLLTTMLYYALKDYKIVVMGTKDNRNIMSQIVVALRHVLMPIRYTYPVVMATLSETHVNYVDTPVPAIVLIWGNEEQCKGLIEQKRKRIEKGGKFDIPTIMIDLMDRMVYSPTPTEKDSAELVFLNNHLITQQLPDIKCPTTIVQRAHNLLFDELLVNQVPQLQTLVGQFKQSFLYRNHIQN